MMWLMNGVSSVFWPCRKSVHSASALRIVLSTQRFAHDIAPSIDIRPLEHGRHRFEFAVTADSLDLDGERFSSISVVATVDVSRETIVEVEAAATARLTCSRTLVEYDEPLSGSLSLVVLREALHEGELDDRPLDEPDLIEAIDGIVNLATPVRDILLLSVPARPVAPEAANVEIQTTFGADGGDVDPRWEALQKLKPADDSRAD